MSEAVWLAGKDPAAMLASLGALTPRKQRLLAVAILRRHKRFCASSNIRSMLDQFETADHDSALQELRRSLQQELDNLDARRQRTLRDRANDRTEYAAQSEGHGVEYPAEVPNAAATILDDDAHSAFHSSQTGGFDAFRVALEGGAITIIAQLIQNALIAEGRATVFSAVAETWRQYADEIAERTANQPRKRTLLISNAVRYIESGRQSLESKDNRKVREIQFAEPLAFVALLREQFGNPFRPVSLDPSWLTANVLDLARTIYDEPAFERMPILADALMDAGCADEAMLDHCKHTAEHVRGCWVVDLIVQMR